MWATSLETIGLDTSNSKGTEIAGSGTANVKSSYTQLVASTGLTAVWIQLMVGHSTSANTADFLYDIATGAAASETVVIADVPFCTGGNTFYTRSTTLIPIAIASGTRIASRVQLNGTATTLFFTISAILGAESDITSGAVTNYGSNTSDSGAVSVDPGGTANTKGSYSQIAASTSAAHNWLNPVLGNQDNGVRTGANWLMDIATGAAASEVVVIPDVWIEMGSTLDVPFTYSWNFGVTEIASSTRLAARMQCSITDATDRTFDLAIFGSNPTFSGGGGGGGEHSHVF